MRREAWIGQHCIERLVNLAWSIFESFARALGSGVKRRDHDKTFARQRREKSGIRDRTTPRFDRSPSAMREKNNWKARPKRDRRIAAGGNCVWPIVKGNFGCVCRIRNQCVERDNILHCDARDASTKSLWICLCGCACDQ